MDPNSASPLKIRHHQKPPSSTCVTFITFLTINSTWCKLPSYAVAERDPVWIEHSNLYGLRFIAKSELFRRKQTIQVSYDTISAGFPLGMPVYHPVLHPTSSLLLSGPEKTNTEPSKNARDPQ